MSNRLTDLKWEEISGVDAPANETPGFLLQKSKELGKEAKAFEEAVVKSFESLSSKAVELYFADADADVKKALSVVLKAFEEGIEDEDKKDEDDSVSKGLIEKLREVFKSEDEDESGDKDEEGESGEEEKGEDKEDEDEKDEADSKDDDGEEKPDVDVEKLAEGIGQAVDKQLEPIREAIVAIADRTEGLEKASAGSSATPGQEGGDEKDKKDETDEDESGIAKAVRTALSKGKVTLS